VAHGPRSVGRPGIVDTRFPDFADLRDSLGLRTPVLLHGAATDSVGTALAGAQVLLSAWPSREQVRALPKGATFATVPVARTAAGRDGSFELRSALTPLLAGLLGKEGLDIGGVQFAGDTLSGYTEQISIGFTFERTGRGRWCGHTGRPSEDDQMVQGYIP